MNKTFKVVLWLIIVGGIIVLLALPKIRQSEKKQSSPQGAANEELPVNILIARSAPLEMELKASGTILANEEVELKTEASGKVTGVYFKEGSVIPKGKLLVKINDSELQAQYQRAEHRIQLSQENERRSKILLEKGGISQAEYDAVINELNILKSERALISAQIAKTEITAPFSGTIGLKNISEGSYVSPSVTVATLQDISKIKIEFSIPEKYVARVRAGNKIVFDVEGIGKNFSGEIYAIDPKIDPLTRTVQIRAIAVNPRSNIFPGAFASITLVFDKIPDAILVPSEVVIPDMKGYKIYLYKSGKAEMAKVELGIRKEKEVQIVQGLASGDTIITTGILQLKPGKRVKIKTGN
ncbi:MAG: efflux RND transporter periplasmic adaptor subunit [Cytophagaceae bacterium]|nr:efflux RND transporter periplasmic adaptor subunit [Cytophagaceae bacterium]